MWCVPGGQRGREHAGHRDEGDRAAELVPGVLVDEQDRAGGRRAGGGRPPGDVAVSVIGEPSTTHLCARRQCDRARHAPIHRLDPDLTVRASELPSVTSRAEAGQRSRPGPAAGGERQLSPVHWLPAPPPRTPPPPPPPDPRALPKVLFGGAFRRPRSAAAAKPPPAPFASPDEAPPEPQEPSPSVVLPDTSGPPALPPGPPLRPAGGGDGAAAAATAAAGGHQRRRLGRIDHARRTAAATTGAADEAGHVLVGRAVSDDDRSRRGRRRPGREPAEERGALPVGRPDAVAAAPAGLDRQLVAPVDGDARAERGAVAGARGDAIRPAGAGAARGARGQDGQLRHVVGHGEVIAGTQRPLVTHAGRRSRIPRDHEAAEPGPTVGHLDIAGRARPKGRPGAAATAATAAVAPLLPPLPPLYPPPPPPPVPAPTPGCSPAPPMPAGPFCGRPHVPPAPPPRPFPYVPGPLSGSQLGARRPSRRRRPAHRCCPRACRPASGAATARDQHGWLAASITVVAPPPPPPAVPSKSRSFSPTAGPATVAPAGRGAGAGGLSVGEAAAAADVEEQRVAGADDQIGVDLAPSPPGAA